jgi:hypothetical protein
MPGLRQREITLVPACIRIKEGGIRLVGGYFGRVNCRIVEKSDIKDVMGEAKGRGYDTKAIRTIIRLRKKDANERLEEESILQTYMAALGME